MNVKVHRGFYNLWLSQKDDVNNAAKYFKPGDVIYITGHSLGATTACFTALDLSHILPTGAHLHLYLYAPPRCGNDRFIDALCKYVPNNWTISNKRDVVTNLPPPTLGILGETWIYDDYRRLVILDIETGSMIENHHVDTYMYAVNRHNKPIDSKQNSKDTVPEHIHWNRPTVSMITDQL
jgi:predicted lipase